MGAIKGPTPPIPPRPPVRKPWWAEKLLTALSSVAGAENVSHAARMQSSRYLIWEEEQGEDWHGDNRHGERAVRGYLNLYTDVELDQWAEDLGAALDDAGILWEWTGTTYEPNTGLWHHSWSWTVV